MSQNNIEKIFSYIGAVSRVPIHVRSNICNFDSGYVPNKILLSESIFNTDSCNMCGRCDVVETEVYGPYECRRIDDCTHDSFESVGLDPKYLDTFRSLMYEDIIRVNGVDIKARFVDSTKSNIVQFEEKSQPRCRWSIRHEETKRKCAIHPLRPITCDMPHLRITSMNRNKHTHISVRQFGRNWALHCPVSIHPPTSCYEFDSNKQNVIRKLKELELISRSYGVETYLRNVIDCLNNITFDNYKIYTYNSDDISSNVFAVNCVHSFDNQPFNNKQLKLF